MKYKPYPKYKDSGVEWLGEIPEGWNAKRIGYHFTDRREKVSDKDYPALSVSMHGIVPQMEHVAKTEDNDNRKLTRIGDLVINSRSDRKGASGLSQYDGSVSLINTVLIPDQSVYGWFAHHLIRSTAFQEEFYRYGKGIVADLWSTNFSEMKDISIPIPSLTTQRAIAAFLDAETARIDGLVKEYEDLIELLKEKRQALISRAVTRGLSEIVSPDDPEFGEWAKPVKFKDSGVEWIGEIPEGWEVKLLKHLAYINDGNHGEEYPNEQDYTSQDDGIAFIRGGNILNLRVNPENMLYITKEKNDSMRKGRLQENDILFINRGDIGKIALITKEYMGSNLNSQIAYIRCNNDLYFMFMLFFLASNSLLSLIESKKMGSVLIQFPIGEIVKIQVTNPPLSEQLAIASFLDRETTKIDTLVSESESAIELLKEHRSALITNAVTGKINVEASA